MGFDTILNRNQIAIVSSWYCDSQLSIAQCINQTLFPIIANKIDLMEIYERVNNSWHFNDGLLHFDFNRMNREIFFQNCRRSYETSASKLWHKSSIVIKKLVRGDCSVTLLGMGNIIYNNYCRIFRRLFKVKNGIFFFHLL